MSAEKNKRRIFLIDREFQIKFIVKFCLLVILSSVIIMGFLYFFSSKSTTVVFENSQAVVKSTADFLLPILVQTVIIVTLITGLFAVILTLLFSHKIAGPLYRFKEELKLIEEGDVSSTFNIRKYDQLKELAERLNSVKAQLKQSLSIFKSEIKDLENKIEQLNVEQSRKDELINNIKKINKEIDYFKT
jgi:methyl-accepting chemotaxis protein